MENITDLNEYRRRRSKLVPIHYHPRVTWLPSHLRYMAETSEINALTRAKKQRDKIVKLNPDLDPIA